MPVQALNNGAYYWRVRAKNEHNIWGDWSDASIWTFRVNDNSNYIRLLSRIQTVGIPQDLIVENNIAYIADGQADLTVVDVTDPVLPTMIGNVDAGTDDFAKGLWKQPGDNYVFIADMDGKVQIADIRQPLDPYALGNVNVGLDQNLEELQGIYYQDSLFMLTVSSGARNFFRLYHIIYDPLPHDNQQFSSNAILLPADAMGLYFDTMSVWVQYHDTTKFDSTYYEFAPGRFVYVANSEAGLQIIDISHTHPFAFPDSAVELIGGCRVVGWGDTPGNALSVVARGKYAYIADDRWGFQIFRLPDTIPSYDNVLPFDANPELISSVNTSGRTKDLQLVGDYCFLADGSGGLKVINVGNPYAPQFVAAYTTPYAYGIWADSGYIYITDRDLGLMIFENRIF